MKRRGFLGLMGGAAVAGPGIAKDAITSLADLKLDLGIPSGADGFGQYSTVGSRYIGDTAGGLVAETHYGGKLARFLENLLDPEYVARKKRSVSVHKLDPDLMQARSFSLAAKIAIQRERNFQRYIANHKSWLERMVADKFDDEDDFL